MNIFKQAAIHRVRFNSGYHNNLTVEDLMNLPLTSKNKSSLDGVYKILKRELRETEEDSLLSTPSSVDKQKMLALEIVTEITQDRLKENEAKQKARLAASRLEEINKIQEDRQRENLLKISDEELEKMKEELKNQL